MIPNQYLDHEPIIFRPIIPNQYKTFMFRHLKLCLSNMKVSQYIMYLVLNCDFTCISNDYVEQWTMFLHNELFESPIEC